MPTAITTKMGSIKSLWGIGLFCPFAGMSFLLFWHAPKGPQKGALRLEAIEALQNPAVIHWAGRYKPWEFQISEHFNRAYYDVLKKTAFCDAPMPQPGDMTGKSLWRQEMRIRLGKIWTRLLGKNKATT